MERPTKRNWYNDLEIYLAREERRRAREERCFAVLKVFTLASMLVLLAVCVIQEQKLIEDCTATETTRQATPVWMYFGSGFFIPVPRSEHLYVCPNNRTLWR
jgi:hypothetical protein